jgi:hypothetical protein
MKTISEATNPNTPAVIKMAPIVDNLIPCCWTAVDVGAATAQYMIAPTTVDTALQTIPGNPMATPLMIDLRRVFTAAQLVRCSFTNCKIGNLVHRKISRRIMKLTRRTQQLLKKCGVVVIY